MAEDNKAEIIPTIDYEIVDLEGRGLDEILNILLEQISNNNSILHGSRSNNPYDELKPRLAYDASRESGNRNAVFATDNPIIAVGLAVFNRKKLLSESDYGTTIGWSSDENGEITFKIDPISFKKLIENPEYFGSGYVYVCDKDRFIQQEDDASEYYSESPQKPKITYKIPANIGQELIDNGLIKAYTDEEWSEIQSQINEQKGQEIAETNLKRINEFIDSHFPAWQADTELTTEAVVTQLRTSPEYDENNPIQKAIIDAILNKNNQSITKAEMIELFNNPPTLANKKRDINN